MANQADSEHTRTEFERMLRSDAYATIEQIATSPGLQELAREALAPAEEVSAAAEVDGLPSRR